MTACPSLLRLLSSSSSAQQQRVLTVESWFSASDSPLGSYKNILRSVRRFRHFLFISLQLFVCFCRLTICSDICWLTCYFEHLADAFCKFRKRVPLDVWRGAVRGSLSVHEVKFREAGRNIYVCIEVRRSTALAANSKKSVRLTIHHILKLAFAQSFPTTNSFDKNCKFMLCPTVLTCLQLTT